MTQPVWRSTRLHKSTKEDLDLFYTDLQRRMLDWRFQRIQKNCLAITHSPYVEATSSLQARVRYIMLENSSIMLLSVTQKKPSIMPEIMLEKYSIMLTWFLLYSTCFNNKDRKSVV